MVQFTGKCRSPAVDRLPSCRRLLQVASSSDLKINLAIVLYLLHWRLAI
ncbi:hypothetical protein O9992_26480 [Vibrio lentus]|nr:hypothetical protein [Vibrio lentus]